MGIDALRMKTRQLVKTMAALTLPLIVGEIFNDLVTTAADDMVITATELMDAESIGALVVEDDGTVEVKIGIVIRTLMCSTLLMDCCLAIHID